MSIIVSPEDVNIQKKKPSFAYGHDACHEIKHPMSQRA